MRTTESLNPGFTAFAAVADPVRRLIGTGDAAAGVARVWQAIDEVGLPRALAQIDGSSVGGRRGGRRPFAGGESGGALVGVPVAINDPVLASGQKPRRAVSNDSRPMTSFADPALLCHSSLE